MPSINTFIIPEIIVDENAPSGYSDLIAAMKIKIAKFGAPQATASTDELINTILAKYTGFFNEETVESDPIMEVINQNGNGKDNMLPIYHYIMEKTDGRVVRDVTTRFNNPAWAMAYAESVRTGMIAPLTGIDGEGKVITIGKIFAINSGDYKFHLLENRLANKGKHFFMRVYDIADTGEEEFQLLNKANFAMASASYSWFLSFDGVGDWGLEHMGLHMLFAKKSTKRGQEVGRMSSLNYYTERASEEFTYRYFTPSEWVGKTYIANDGVAENIVVINTKDENDPINAMLVDGISFCTKRFAMKLARHSKSMRHRIFSGKMTRLNIRIVSRRGVLKGDVIIVPKASQLKGATFVTCDENIKGELFVKGGDDWMQVTASEHKPLHVAGWNVQSTGNFRGILNFRREMADIERMKVAAIENIVTGAHSKEINPEMDYEEVIRDSGIKGITNLESLLARDVPFYGLHADKKSSQQYLFMDYNGEWTKMEKGVERRHQHPGRGLHKKKFIPMSNGINGAIVAHTAMNLMGGFNLPETDKVIFVEGAGMVIPDQRFTDTFDLHGTWDQDDVADFILIKVWSDDPAYVELLRKDKVLPATGDIPTTEDGAVYMVAVVRSPNGPGEYAIEWADQSVLDVMDTLILDDPNLIVNLGPKMSPRGQSFMLRSVKLDGFKDSELDPMFAEKRLMSREDAQYMIEAQMTNTGIGGLANALMCWVDVMGASFPRHMTQVLGEMVDAVQQGFDKEQLETCAKESKRIFQQLVDAMEIDPTLTIDHDLMKTRMPVKFIKKIRGYQVNRKGRMTTTNAAYKVAMAEIKEQGQTMSLTLRNESDLANKIRPLHIGNDVVDGWAPGFVKYWEAEFMRIKNENRAIEGDNSFAKLMKQQNELGQMRIAVDSMVATVRKNAGDQLDRYMIGLYQYFLMTHKGRELGKHDRILFQTSAGDTNLMRLFVQACLNRGLVTAPPAEEEIPEELGFWATWAEEVG